MKTNIRVNHNVLSTSGRTDDIVDFVCKWMIHTDLRIVRVACIMQFQCVEELINHVQSNHVGDSWDGTLRWSGCVAIQQVSGSIYVQLVGLLKYSGQSHDCDSGSIQ